MIAFLKGAFVHKTPALVHIDVQGVGYEVHISLNTFSAIQGMDNGRLYTHLQIREDAHVLYGFYSADEKEMFLHLLSVSGVGAATARMMLSSLTAEELTRAIVGGNVKALEAIKGIGKKSAERLVLELKDKLGKKGLDANISQQAGNSTEQDALNALIALGISRPHAETAVKKVLATGDVPSTIEDIIKKALKTL